MTTISVTPKRAQLSYGSLTAVWYAFNGRWQFHNAGGIFCAAREGRFKLLEMITGAYEVTDPDGKVFSGTVAAVEEAEDGLRLRLGPVETGDVTWQGSALWRFEGDRLTWRYELTPSRVVAEEYRVSLRFHLLPSRWRTVMLGSYIGYVGATAYAIQPTRDSHWWPRVAAEQIIRNVHAPATLLPTARAAGKERVTLAGVILAGEYSPRELLDALWAHHDPQPLPTRRPLPETLAAALAALKTNAAAARATGHLAADETAFLNISTGKGGFLDRDVFGCGFTCAFSGHAIRPLLEYAAQTGADETRGMALGIARYIARHTQTPYGAYYDNWNNAIQGGYDFIGEDYVYPSTTAKIAENMLAAARESASDALLADSGLRACDWLLTLQAQDGGLPWKLSGTSGESDGTDAYAVTAASALSAWVMAHRLTGQPKYLAACARLADWLEREFIRPRRLCGYITDDHPGNGLNRWETSSSTPGSYAVDGLLDLYQVNGERRYLDLALETAAIQLLWMWLWQPDHGLPRRLLGTAQQGTVWEYTQRQTVGNENLYMVWNYQRLHALTRDPLWQRAAWLGLSRAEDDQFYQPGDARHGALSEGFDINTWEDISFNAGDPHANYLGVPYLIRAIMERLR